MAKRTRWLDGGVSNHAVDRLIGQYNFPGGIKAARKFLRKCKGKEKDARIIISLDTIRSVQGWMLEKKIFLEVQSGKVENIKEIRACS
ncbi:hypothetical protein KKB71_00200 [Patescibacteria group bacterium]|nr:hypothetical protein [Patescibacteria group bacterium]MBU2219417.1 hypothetical protein [Patescibacteria group bacterium]MBU2263586.1 hypothetical protein [Patescibacteria group bacterium]